jgi:LPXTG-motif cell wall-anchored protein
LASRSSTEPDAGITLPDAGVTTTTAGEGPTTTAEVGAGTLDPGQVTTTTSETRGTDEPGEKTTTTADEVAGGSDDTLPHTGVGDMTMGGLAGILITGGILLLLLAGRKSDTE